MDIEELKKYLDSSKEKDIATLSLKVDSYLYLKEILNINNIRDLIIFLSEDELIFPTLEYSNLILKKELINKLNKQKYRLLSQEELLAAYNIITIEISDIIRKNKDKLTKEQLLEYKAEYSRICTMKIEIITKQMMNTKEVLKNDSNKKQNNKITKILNKLRRLK